MNLIGRDADLGSLARSDATGTGTYCVVTGRRGVGKTAFLHTFGAGRNCVFLTPIGANGPEILKSLAEALDIGHEVDNLGEIVAAFKNDPKVRTTYIIDDLQEILRTVDGSEETLIGFIENELRNLNIFLVLSIRRGTFPRIENLDSVMVLNPLRYRFARLLHPDMTEEDRMKMYFIAGGIPAYHLGLDMDTAKESVTYKICDSQSFFLSDTECEIRSCRPDDTAVTVLGSIASGCRSLKDIAYSSNISEPAAIKVLKSLIDRGTVSRDDSIGGSKQARYHICDPPVLFFLTMAAGIRALWGHEPEYIYSKLKDQLNEFYSVRFDELCLEYTSEMDGCVECGRWWNKDSEIQIIARYVRAGQESFLLGDSKYKNKKAGMKRLEDLQERRESVRDIANVGYILFSRMGFTDELIAYSRDPSHRVELVAPEDMHRSRELLKDSLDTV
ncbi:MAG: hypothetical protein IJ856_03700 [Candidatus Methanomethylophilaceae archaeon]|nr:hypothetical protein [Candidatus Methanomethylophilaceae archaeon]